MSSASRLVTLDTCRKYLQLVGLKPSPKLLRCFACGLPKIWLYLKAVGLEDLYFKLLAELKTTPHMYKHVFYFLKLSNGQNKFFPMPQDFLQIEIPPVLAAAVVQVAKPAFEMTYNFNAAQLAEVLSAVVQPNYMVRVGNQRQAIGIMFKEEEGVYYAYSINQVVPEKFNDLGACVDFVMQNIKARAQEDRRAVKIEVGGLQGMEAEYAPLPHAKKYYDKFIRADIVPPSQTPSPRRLKN